MKKTDDKTGATVIVDQAGPVQPIKVFDKKTYLSEKRI